MDTSLLPLLPFCAALAFLLIRALRPVSCPDCGDRLPPFTSPFKKSRRMWLAGGCRCAWCGCETDSAGRKVTAKSPPARRR